jgi:hypothetical protein
LSEIFASCAKKKRKKENKIVVLKMSLWIKYRCETNMHL